MDNTLYSNESISASIHPGEVIIGEIIGFHPIVGQPLVEFPANPTSKPLSALTTLSLSQDHIGRNVALLFTNGDLSKPVIMGLIQTGEENSEMCMPNTPSEAMIDGERVTFSAKKEIVLQCGKASITLTQAGKIIIRGAYLLSRSSGLNKIKGATIEIN